MDFPYIPYICKIWETVFALRSCVCSGHIKTGCQDKIRFLRNLSREKILWRSMKKGNRKMLGDLLPTKQIWHLWRRSHEKRRASTAVLLGLFPLALGAAHKRMILGCQWECFKEWSSSRILFNEVTLPHFLSEHH